MSAYKSGAIDSGGTPACKSANSSLDSNRFLPSVSVKTLVLNKPSVLPYWANMCWEPDCGASNSKAKVDLYAWREGVSTDITPDVTGL